MEIRIVYPTAALRGLATVIAEMLSPEYAVSVRLLKGLGNDTRMLSGTVASMAELQRIATLMQPMTVPIESNRGPIRGCDVEIRLGKALAFGRLKLKCTVDSAAFATPLGRDLDGLGFAQTRFEENVVGRTEVKYGGAPSECVDAVCFLLRRRGLTPQRIKAWNDRDMDIWVSVQEPAHANLPVHHWLPVFIATDDPLVGGHMKQSLVDKGFGNVQVRNLMKPDRSSFELDLGPLNSAEHHVLASMLRVEMAAVMRDEGVDLTRFALHQKKQKKGLKVFLRVPIRAHREGTLRPYHGAVLERFRVAIHSDCPVRAAEVMQAFETEGFGQVHLGGSPDDSMGFVVSLGEAKKHPKVVKVVRQVLSGALNGWGVGPLVMQKGSPSDTRSNTIHVALPLNAYASGELEGRLREAANEHKIVVGCSSSACFTQVREDLKRMGFRRFKHHRGGGVSGGSGRLQYGGAPSVLVAMVRDRMSRLGVVGADAELENAWPPFDRDIYIDVVANGGEETCPAESTAAPFDPDAWLAQEGADQKQLKPFFAKTGAFLQVGEVQLERRETPDPNVPDLASFSHYVLDSGTCALLAEIAECVAMREPCLLEGPTATSKTSAVRYLAARLGQPVVRLNLSGHTDTGELLGRYVPDPAGKGWIWKDGLVVRAMRQGHWVILDELNLAEPQVLERLNPLLEAEPTLVLSEHADEVFGPGGRIVHDAFRLFATQNPVEYAGRSTLSPAYRDRWCVHRVKDTASSETAVRALLDRVLFGVQPPVTTFGRTYAGAAVVPIFPALAAVIPPAFVGAVSRFHAAAHVAASSSEGRPAKLGGSAREGYVFTRRGLLRMMAWLEARVSGRSDMANGDLARLFRRALLRTYVERVRTEDRAVMVGLLDACGIGPNTWAVAERRRAEGVV